MITATLTAGPASYILTGDHPWTKFERGVPVPVDDATAATLERDMPGCFVFERDPTPESLVEAAPAELETTEPEAASEPEAPAQPSKQGPELSVSI